MSRIRILAENVVNDALCGQEYFRGSELQLRHNAEIEWGL